MSGLNVSYLYIQASRQTKPHNQTRKPNDVIDDNRVGGEQKVGEALWDFGELQTWTVKDL